MCEESHVISVSGLYVEHYYRDFKESYILAGESSSVSVKDREKGSSPLTS